MQLRSMNLTLHGTIIVLNAVLTELVKAHLDVERVLKDVKAHWTVKTLFDLVEQVDVDLLIMVLLFITSCK